MAWIRIRSCPPPRSRAPSQAGGPAEYPILGDASGLPPRLDLEQDVWESADPYDIEFDIDSAGLFATSLAVARQGIQWLFVRPPTTNLNSSLRLKTIPAEIYLLFPGLYSPKQSHAVITVKDYRKWINKVLLSVLHDTYGVAVIQSTAASCEGSTQQTNAPRIRLLTNPLDGHELHRLWGRVLALIRTHALQEFGRVKILVTAKALTRDKTWARAQERFFSCWNAAIDAVYIEQDVFDVGKQMVPGDPSRPGDTTPPTLSWRRCCLERYSAWLQETRFFACAADGSSPSSPAGVDLVARPDVAPATIGRGGVPSATRQMFRDNRWGLMASSHSSYVSGPVRAGRRLMSIWTVLVGF
ncbi:hypothetical protein FE257_003845 [Aspergillus nanangensis]|uniref:Uncharacterized protein n=1 Tax=Aspergillus nanangensis TaxID=2582783 RepID=A0AAD4CCB1_ASPNN|nr:hypothetical protein FE257_003845 [Aspergillus nanangensis]